MTCPECKTDTATIIGQHGEGRNKIRRYQCETCRLIFERTAREVSPVHAFREALRDLRVIR